MARLNLANVSLSLKHVVYNTAIYILLEDPNNKLKNNTTSPRTVVFSQIDGCIRETILPQKEKRFPYTRQPTTKTHSVDKMGRFPYIRHTTSDLSFCMFDLEHHFTLNLHNAYIFYNFFRLSV